MGRERTLLLTYKHLFFHPGFLSVQLFLLQPLQLEGIVPRIEDKHACSATFHQHSKSEYLLFLLLGLAFAAGLVLVVCIQLGLSVRLVLREEQDVLGLILHPPHVGSLTLTLSPLEVRNRYVNITRITCGDD